MHLFEQLRTNFSLRGVGWRPGVRTLRRKVREMVRKLYRHFLEHTDEPVPTSDKPTERFPRQEVA